MRRRVVSMNLVETNDLLAFIAELDYRRFTEETVAAWWQVLGKYELHECREAVVAHYDTTEPEFLKPNHITTQIRLKRRRRMGEVTRFELNPVDDHRGPGAPKQAFEDFQNALADVKDAVGRGEVSRSQYQAYLAGRTPWREFVVGLRRGQIES